ncbi:hypothetical protein PMAYCL1PPCAC_19900, partial [Pristionchus mayeri]
THTLYTLNGVKLMSEASRRQHRRLTKSLIATVVIPGLIFAVPQTTLIALYFMGLDKPEIIPFVFEIIGTHSIIHSITVILTTD